MSSACQEIIRIFRSQLLITTLTTAPTVPILNHTIPVHACFVIFEDLFQYFPHTYAEVIQVLPSLQFLVPKPLYVPLLSPIRATCPDHFILLDLFSRKLFGEEQ